jgi:hypothetical protein
LLEGKDAPLEVRRNRLTGDFGPAETDSLDDENMLLSRALHIFVKIWDTCQIVAACQYAYLIEPGGNRFGLTGEMPRAVEHASAPSIWTDFPEAASAWGVLPPESFGHGS